MKSFEKSKYPKEIEQEMQTFEFLLKKEKLKVTSQRLLVAQTIFSIHHHFTADSLLEMFKDRRSEISKATIYRILNIMVKGNLLIEHDFGKEYKFYEHVIGHEHHDHIICINCGRIVEFLDEQIEELQEKAAMSNGFKIKGHRLNIYGECINLEKCKYNPNNKKSKN
ncbi:MAG: Fur family transcriptional regulator [Candidatus Pacearchaeota archaeon]